jgi:pyrroline-5-carboxylate reductase
MPKSIGFIGGGRITAIFLAAWKDSGLALEPVVVSDGDPEVLARLQARFPEIQVTGDNRVPAGRELVFMSLHPPVAREVLPALAGSLLPGALVVSLAPVLSFERLSGLLGGFGRLARMIPNAPSLIHRGYNPLAFAPGLPAAERAELLPWFDPLGEHPEVDENKLEAYAILAAMGPTYFWPQWQTLRDLAAEFGLEAKEADRAVNAMLHGAAGLMFESGLGFAEVLDTVPVKPLADSQDIFEQLYRDKLGALYARLKA